MTTILNITNQQLFQPQNIEALNLLQRVLDSEYDWNMDLSIQNNEPDSPPQLVYKHRGKEQFSLEMKLLIPESHFYETVDESINHDTIAHTLISYGIGIMLHGHSVSFEKIRDVSEAIEYSLNDGVLYSDFSRYLDFDERQNNPEGFNKELSRILLETLIDHIQYEGDVEWLKDPDELVVNIETINNNNTPGEVGFKIEILDHQNTPIERLSTEFPHGMKNVGFSKLSKQIGDLLNIWHEDFAYTQEYDNKQKHLANINNTKTNKPSLS